jgi:hypothetical protein
MGALSGELPDSSSIRAFRFPSHRCNSNIIGIFADSSLAIPPIQATVTKALFQIIIASVNETHDIKINMKGRGASECAQI